MLTPGVAGTTTTMITGTLVSQFGLPGNWTGLVISLLFGLSVWADKSVPVYQRIIFYIINSMTIFAVAIGINTAGMVINQPTERSVGSPCHRGKAFAGGSTGVFSGLVSISR